MNCELWLNVRSLNWHSLCNDSDKWFVDFTHVVAERMKIADDLGWSLVTRISCSKTQESLKKSFDQRDQFEKEICRNHFGDVLAEAKSRMKHVLNDEKWVYVWKSSGLHRQNYRSNNALVYC